MLQTDFLDSDELSSYLIGETRIQVETKQQAITRKAEEALDGLCWRFYTEREYQDTAPQPVDNVYHSGKWQET